MLAQKASGQVLKPLWTMGYVIKLPLLCPFLQVSWAFKHNHSWILKVWKRSYILRLLLSVKNEQIVSLGAAKVLNDGVIGSDMLNPTFFLVCIAKRFPCLLYQSDQLQIEEGGLYILDHKYITKFWTSNPYNFQIKQ